MNTEYKPAIRYRQTGLYVVPSIHHRQAFAQLVYEACYETPFDVIALELPASYQKSGLIETVVDMLPTTGVLIEPHAAERDIEIPYDPAQGGFFPPKQRATVGHMFPVSPSDSILMGMRVPKLLDGRHPGWKPEILLIDADSDLPRTEGTVPPSIDDYEVTLRGPKVVYERMESAWHEARDPAVDLPREKTMGAALRMLIDAKKKTLFVCGAAHWNSIREYLDSGYRDAPKPSHAPRKVDWVQAPLRPETLWQWGWLDDMPRCVWDFQTACENWHRFDKASAVERIFEQATIAASADGLPASPRRLSKMKRYLQALLISRGFWLPRLVSDFLHAATSCVGKSFSRQLKNKAMEYPQELPPSQDYAYFTMLESGEFAIVVDGETYALKTAKDAAIGPTLPVPIETARDEHGDAEDGDSHLSRSGYGPAGFSRGFLPTERDLTNLLLSQARTLAHKPHTRKTFSKPFVGHLGEGIDIRKTVGSIPTGRTLFIKEPKARKKPREEVCDKTCPVVWIYDTSRPSTSLWSGAVMEHDPRRAQVCYDFFLWCTRATDLGPRDEITQRRVAYAVSLTTGLLPTRGRTQRDVDRFKSWYPAERLCQSYPSSQADLKEFKDHERAIACAAKYAGDHVVIVAPANLQLSEKVQNYAREKGVEFKHVDSNRFDPELLKRLSLYHSVPWLPGSMEPPEYVEDLVPPVTLVE